MDTIRALFEDLAAGGWESIQRFQDEKQEESGVLDFKTAQNGSAPMTSGDRKTLAEALSGFANSDGGLLVWGVDARPGPDGVDVVQGIKPINEIRRFLSDLNSYTPQVVSPAVIGVEHSVVMCPEKEDVGVAITYVPKGADEPHMAVAKGQNCYYYRSGESFLCMQSFMIADRYRRRPQPVLEFWYSITGGWRTNKKISKRINVGINNMGAGVALYPALKIVQSVNATLIAPGLLTRCGHSQGLQTPNQTTKQE